MKPETPRNRRIGTVVLAALGWGVLGALVGPLVVYTATQGFNALTDACSRGPAGDCDMAAAVFGLMALIPGAVLGATIGAIRALRSQRSD